MFDCFESTFGCCPCSIDFGCLQRDIVFYVCTILHTHLNVESNVIDPHFRVVWIREQSSIILFCTLWNYSRICKFFFPLPEIFFLFANIFSSFCWGQFLLFLCNIFLVKLLICLLVLMFNYRGTN